MLEMADHVLSSRKDAGTQWSWPKEGATVLQVAELDEQGFSRLREPRWLRGAPGSALLTLGLALVWCLLAVSPFFPFAPSVLLLGWKHLTCFSFDMEDSLLRDYLESQKRTWPLEQC